MLTTRRIASFGLLIALITGSYEYRWMQTRKSLSQAETFLIQNKDERAVEALQRVLLYSPNLPYAYYLLGKTYYERFNNLEQAEHYLDRYLTLFSAAPAAAQARQMLERVRADLEWANAPAALPPAPGPYLQGGVDPGQAAMPRKVLAYYYYWYDETTGDHIRDRGGADALTLHEPPGAAVSYHDVAWHRKHLSDMAYAGVDVVLPVFWGRCGRYDSGDRRESWPVEGLKNLVEACRQLEREKLPCPRIGLFLDENIFAYHYKNVFNLRAPVDLTTWKGRELLYGSVRDFFSLVPPELRAAERDRPLVFLYIQLPNTPAYNQETFDHLRARFVQDFGGLDPFVVSDYRYTGVHTDARFAWCAAIKGVLPNPESPEFFSSVCCIGPGYDDSAQKDRNIQKRPREDGDFYRRNWEAAFRLKPRLLVVETWNELHEGSAVCETREFGRKYIELTREYSARFRALK